MDMLETLEREEPFMNPFAGDADVSRGVVCETIAALLLSSNGGASGNIEVLALIIQIVTIIQSIRLNVLKDFDVCALCLERTSLADGSAIFPFPH